MSQKRKADGTSAEQSAFAAEEDEESPKLLCGKELF
jgi:hypothetical protein